MDKKKHCVRDKNKSKRMKSLLFIFEISSFHFETPQELFLNNYESPQYENETKRTQNIKVETTETHDLRFWHTLSMETKLL